MPRLRLAPTGIHYAKEYRFRSHVRTLWRLRILLLVTLSFWTQDEKLRVPMVARVRTLGLMMMAARTMKMQQIGIMPTTTTAMADHRQRSHQNQRDPLHPRRQKRRNLRRLCHPALNHLPRPPARILQGRLQILVMLMLQRQWQLQTLSLALLRLRRQQKCVVTLHLIGSHLGIT